MTDVKTDPASLRELADKLRYSCSIMDLQVISATLSALAAEKEAPPAEDLVERVALAISKPFADDAGGCFSDGDLCDDTGDTTTCGCRRLTRLAALAALSAIRPGDPLPGWLVAARGALKPFADEANRYDPDEGDDDGRAWDTAFSIGALRRAREALSTLDAVLKETPKT